MSKATGGRDITETISKYLVVSTGTFFKIRGARGGRNDNTKSNTNNNNDNNNGFRFVVFSRAEE
jgi:hypothetical protein